MITPYTTIIYCIFKSITASDTMEVCYYHSTFLRVMIVTYHSINTVRGYSNNTMVLPCLKNIANILKYFMYKKHGTTTIFVVPRKKQYMKFSTIVFFKVPQYYHLIPWYYFTQYFGDIMVLIWYSKVLPIIPRFYHV